MKKLVTLWLRQTGETCTYYLRWRERTGKTRRSSLGHGDRHLAEIQRQKKEAELRNGLPAEVTPNKVTIWNLCFAYLAAESTIESSTAELTERAVRYMVEALGDIRVVDFDYRQAQRFQSWLISTGRNEVSANIYIKTVRPVFRWAVRQHLIAADPFAELNMFRISRKQIRIYTQREFQELFRSCPSGMWQARVLLAKTAGLRRGEIMNLTLDDIDFDHGLIFVQPKREGRSTWRWVVKDKDRRELPLVPELSRVLVDLVNDLPEGQPYPLISVDRYEQVMRLKARSVLPDRVRRCPDENFKPWRRIRKLAGIKHGTFHDLRRTCITEWLENGLEPHEAMRLAGHSDVETTMNYYVTTRRSLIDKARLASSRSLLCA